MIAVFDDSEFITDRADTIEVLHITTTISNRLETATSFFPRSGLLFVVLMNMVDIPKPIPMLKIIANANVTRTRMLNFVETATERAPKMDPITGSRYAAPANPMVASPDFILEMYSPETRLDLVYKKRTY